MDQRSRGRARGQPRSQDAPYGQRPGPSRGGQGGQQRPSQPMPATAWGGPRPQTQMRGPTPAVQPIQAGRAHYRSGAGDSSSVEPEQQSGVVQVTEGGDPGLRAGTSGRGALRGGRILEVVVTKPKSCATKQGTFGNRINLMSNYFKLIHTSQWCLYQYHVDFAPTEDLTKVRKVLFYRAIKDYLNGFLYDGTVMYTPTRLPNDVTNLVVENNDQKIAITVRLVGQVTPYDYHYIQIFNIIIRKCMSYLKLQLINRDYFDPAAKINMPEHHLEIWPGYVTSIRQHEKDILMCCETLSKVMRNDTVLQLLMQCSNDDRDNVKRLFTERVTGMTVITSYNNRPYRIDDVDWESTPMSTFKKSDGSSISYVEYYHDRYKIKICNTTQPMLISRAKPREIRAGMSELCYIVPELCRMTGLTDAQRANFRFMQDFAQHTRLGPTQRMQKLVHFSRRLLENPQAVQELKNWDFQLSNNLVKFTARVLPPEQITGGNNAVYSAGPQVDWTRNLRSTPQCQTRELTQWVMVCTNRNRSQAQRFGEMIERAARGMNWNISRARICEIRDDKPGVYVNELHNIIDQLRPQLIMCVVSNNKQDRYSSIKKLCCVDKPVATQVIQARNLDSKNSMTIATKVVIQMNCKIGGAPWYLKIPVEGLMIVGYDACHDPRQKSRSYGAVVATYDKTQSHYFGTYTAHTKGEEMSNDFALNILKALEVYRAENQGNYPRKIIIYRDGVGEGNIPHVRDYELNQILKVLQDKYQKQVELAFIIVSKRINTRFFTDQGNPPPGTVVDDVVTLPEKYDFFLVSQCVRQGTVTPTNYSVIHDTTGLSADHIQRLTYKMTHMYFNWSGGVRVPAPCQYAHKLAFLASQCLQRDANPELERVLYYL